MLFTIDTGESFDDASIAVVSLESGERRILAQGGSNPHYAPTGHLVFARRGALVAAPFDVARLEVTGLPVAVLQGVVTDPRTGAAQFAFSDTGSLVYVRGDVWMPDHAVVWVTREGEVESLMKEERPVRNPSLSPDGRRIALTISEGSNSDIWMYDVGRETLTRLTFHPGEDFNPVWSPDGKRIAFSSEMSGGGPQLYWVATDGSGAPEPLVSMISEGLGADAPTSWSPDGKVLAYGTRSLTTGRDIWVLPLDGERKPRAFLATEFNEYGATFSTDGHWIAYHSDESGRVEVYVQPFPGPGRKWQISTDGGAWPVWAPGGRELCYRNGDKMMVVTVDTEPELTPGKPRLLFEGRYTYGIGTHPNYSIASDGRFVMAGIEELELKEQLHVVLNWFEELKRLVPAAMN